MEDDLHGPASGRFFRLNGVLCKAADGADGFRPSDVFAGLPLQLCPPEDCPRSGRLAHETTPVPDLGVDSDCAVLNAFAVLSGGVVLDPVTQTFADFTSHGVVVPADTTLPGPSSAPRTKPAPGDIHGTHLYVASSLVPMNTVPVARNRRRRRNVSPEALVDLDVLAPQQMRYVVEKMRKPMAVPPPELAFPLQHNGLFLTRSHLVAATHPGTTASAFTCFSGRPIWCRAYGARRDPVACAKRPELISTLGLHFTDTAHATDQGVRMASSLTVPERLMSFPAELRGWPLHWWIFSRFVAYLEIDIDPPAIRPVPERDAFYVAQATRVIEDVKSGAYQRPDMHQTSRCWHLLVCADTPALLLRLRRFETFFHYVTKQQSATRAARRKASRVQRRRHDGSSAA